jgi:hypothetical protein
MLKHGPNKTLPLKGSEVRGPLFRVGTMNHE